MGLADQAADLIEDPDVARGDVAASGIEDYVTQEGECGRRHARQAGRRRELADGEGEGPVEVPAREGSAGTEPEWAGTACGEPHRVEAREVPLALRRGVGLLARARRDDGSKSEIGRRMWSPARSAGRPTARARGR